MKVRCHPDLKIWRICPIGLFFYWLSKLVISTKLFNKKSILQITIIWDIAVKKSKVKLYLNTVQMTSLEGKMLVHPKSIKLKGFSHFEKICRPKVLLDLSRNIGFGRRSSHPMFSVRYVSRPGGVLSLMIFITIMVAVYIWTTFPELLVYRVYLSLLLFFVVKQ